MIGHQSLQRRPCCGLLQSINRTNKVCKSVVSTSLPRAQGMEQPRHAAKLGYECCTAGLAGACMQYKVSSTACEISVGRAMSCQLTRRVHRAGSTTCRKYQSQAYLKLGRKQGRDRQTLTGAVIHPAPDVQLDRTALAQELGYRSIGADLPDNVSLGNIISSLPAEVFEVDDRKAWSAVLLTTCSVLASIALIAYSPWYLLPFAWIFAGTAWTGMFVVGHDCGHRSFSKNKLIEDIVGTIMFMPLIYPFEPWRLKHNQHHAHTNKLVDDTAWHPVLPEQAETWDPVSRFVLRTFLGSPLKLWASVGHWLIWHFDLNLYTEKQKPRVIVSLAAVGAFIGIGLPAIFFASGFAGLLKFWLVPWLGYHFWMSTFTVVHHTAPHIPFKPASSWNAAKAQLSGTVHCDYPKWVEVLCHDINVHVPHHVSPKIPWYNLRKATDSLRGNWGEYMTEARWNWRMMKVIFTELHFYDSENNYRPFDFLKEEKFLAMQRKLLPNTFKA